jgi:hypothetical protein
MAREVLLVQGMSGDAAAEAVMLELSLAEVVPQTAEAVDSRSWLRSLRRLLFSPPRPKSPAVSEILEAHRMAWRRIEIRRQEFAPPDLAVAQRIMMGLGKTSRRHYGYERKAQRPLARASLA